LLPLLVKFIATALVFVLVTETVARFGPRLGGVLAGLPMVLGPGFFFLGLDHPAPFVAGAAVATLHALAATACLVGAYVLVARHLSAAPSVALATLAWGVAVTAFTWLPDGWPAAVIAYAATFLAWIAVLPDFRRPPHGLPVNRVQSVQLLRPLQPVQPPVQTVASEPARGVALAVWYRGGLAGLLVAGASVLGESLGPTAPGLVLGFPIGTVLIVWSVHHRNGPDVGRPTARAAMVGMICLAVFAWILAAFPGERHGPMAVFPFALAASLGVNLLLAWWAVRRGGNGPQATTGSGSVR
jgi:hypothetical protein